MKIKIIKTKERYKWKLGEIHQVLKELSKEELPDFGEPGYLINTDEGSFYIRKSWCKIFLNSWRDRLI